MRILSAESTPTGVLYTVAHGDETFHISCVDKVEPSVFLPQGQAPYYVYHGKRYAALHLALDALQHDIATRLGGP